MTYIDGYTKALKIVTGDTPEQLKEKLTKLQKNE